MFFNYRVYGIFDQRKPLLIIRDPEVIKRIVLKDFDHFINHRQTFGELDENSLFSHSMFLMKDAKWKDMRSTLSPFFTGSKMRLMFHLILEVTQKSSDYLKQKVNNQGQEVDIKDFFTRYTNDIIASTAFGLQVNSFENEKNEFYLMGKRVTNFSFVFIMKFLLYGISKRIMKVI